MEHMLPQYLPIDDKYTSFSLSDNFAPYAISLPILDTSPMVADAQRRLSFDSIESSIPPELLSVSSAGTTSPSTPLNGSLFDSSCMDSFRATVPHANFQSMWGPQQNDLAEHEFGFSPVAAKDQINLSFFNPYSIVHTTSDVHNPSVTFYSNQYHVLSNDALSRSIFNDTIPSLTPTTTNDTQWLPATVEQIPPRTIDPSRFAQLTSSLPAVKAEPCTPSKQYPRASIILSSSPMLGYSPEIVPSQHELDDLADFGLSSLPQMPDEPIYERVERGRRLQSRLARRRYRHKDLGSTGKRRLLANNSGIDCEAFIPQNSFACSYADCIDKNTGKQKRFKRREHKKRHEKTVHEKDTHASHRCWVPKCDREFSRTDNLKSHLKNTHGKKSANARNRYVATLDPHNLEYYSPDWAGDLTIEGLPIER